MAKREKIAYYKGEPIIHRPIYKARYVFKNIGCIIDDIKEFWHRGKCGYGMTDVWNMDTWFINIMPHMLNDLIQGGMSYPGRGEADTPEKWQAILERMKYCFEEANEETCSKQNEWEDTFNLDMKFGPIDPKTQVGAVTFECDNEENHEKYRNRDLELYNYREAMRKEGMELFCKWFNDLWD